jgi:AcrR family transcriptional regulator
MPKKVDHQQRRDHIAEALMRVVADNGLEAVSLRHVASEAGVTSGMVQHYFPSKEAMVDFAMESASARFETRMTNAIETLGENPPTRSLLRTMLATLLPTDETEQADGRVALAFLAHAATRPDAAKHVGDDNTMLRRFISDLLHDAQAAGTARSTINPAHAAIALLATAEGLGVQVLSSNLPADVAIAALDTQLELIFG